jgi:hypothetical protein
MRGTRGTLCIWLSALQCCSVMGQRLERKRSGGELSQIDVKSSLDELWKAETALAQLEAERLLQGWMSYPPPTPNRPPTPRPTFTRDSPTPRPVLTPIPTSIPGNPTHSPNVFTPIPTLASAPTGGSPRPSGNSVPSSPFPTFVGGPTASCLANLTRNEFLLEYLSTWTSSDQLLMQDSPQGQAFIFMTEQDALMPNVCVYATLEQRYALATFYYSTSGGDWNANPGWLGDLQECEWFGIACDSDDLVVNMTLRKFICDRTT